MTWKKLQKCFYVWPKTYCMNINKWLLQENIYTSKRFFRDGTSIPAISTRFANWALWWSFKNCSTGTTPSGQIKTSSSSPDVNCTFWTYFGKHSATYLPKSVKFERSTESDFLRVAVTNKMKMNGLFIYWGILVIAAQFFNFLRLLSVVVVASVDKNRSTVGPVLLMATIWLKKSKVRSVGFIRRISSYFVMISHHFRYISHFSGQ